MSDFEASIAKAQAATAGSGMSGLKSSLKKGAGYGALAGIGYGMFDAYQRKRNPGLAFTAGNAVGMGVAGAGAGALATGIWSGGKTLGGIAKSLYNVNKNKVAEAAASMKRQGV
mgnify:CR=1 FL=1